MSVDWEKDFELEDAAFKVMLPTLLVMWPDWFVAVKNGCIVDRDQEEMALATRVEQKYPREFVLIRQVKEQSEEHLPSPEGEVRRKNPWSSDL
jgi:hypothetical protein